MKKFLFQSIGLLFIIIFSLLFTTGAQFKNVPFFQQGAVIKTVVIGEARIKAEFADTSAKRSKGLSGREKLGSDEGMLFVFEKKGQYPFWMKGLTYPLDLIWIREDKVVDISENLQPPAVGQKDDSLPIYQPKEEVDKVLEVNGGTAKRSNINVGNTVAIIE